MTLKEIAKDLGVSASTVSRVLNGCNERFTIPDELRQRILTRVKECGYEPNPVFRALRTKKNHQIAFLFYSRSSLATGETVEVVVDRATRQLEAHNYDVVYMFSRQARKFGYSLPQWKVAGLLIPDVQTPESLAAIENAQIPYVAINGYCGPAGTAVQCDDYHAMTQILDYLYRLNHRRILYLDTAFVNQEPSVMPHKIQREQAFFDFMKQHGCHPMKSTLWNIPEEDSAINSIDLPSGNKVPIERQNKNRGFEELLMQGASAIVTTDEVNAQRLLHAAWQKGLSVPRDLSIVTFNDKAILETTIPALTAFRLPAEAMGVEAARILLQKLENPDYLKGETIALRGQLVERATAGPCPA